MPLETRSPTVYLSIVIPAYNEARCITEGLTAIARHLSSRGVESELIVVDDGSTDDTAAKVVAFAKTHPSVRLIRNERNLGKGAGVKRGVLAARGEYVFFMDADLAVPVEALDGGLEVLVRGEAPILIGCRNIVGARIERRQPVVREFLGHAFTSITRRLLSPSVADFTCGFKGFRRNEARILFSLQRCNGWAFDAEILYLARLLGQSVHQYPVRWSHQEKTRVRLLRDIVLTLVALFRIRLRGKRLTREHQAARPATVEQTTK